MAETRSSNHLLRSVRSMCLRRAGGLASENMPGKAQHPISAVSGLSRRKSQYLYDNYACYFGWRFVYFKLRQIFV